MRHSGAKPRLYSRMARLVPFLAILLAFLPPIFAQQPTFRAETDLVNFGVTVTDSKGTFLTDLTVDDFEVLEDGKKQTVKYFTRGDDTAAAPELHIGLLFDTSGSMGEDIQLSRSAAVEQAR